MKAMWTIVFCAVALSLSAAQDNGSGSGNGNGSGNPTDPNHPVLTTRPPASTADAAPPAIVPPGGYNPKPVYAPPNVIPEGTRFIIMLKDTLDTRKMQQGQHFKAELREDLVTPSGSIIPKGRPIKGHVGTFERGFTGARIMLAMDEIETRHGWVPLVATVMGVPGDPSIKSTENEGELTQKGPDKKRVIENAAVGAAVGAASGAVAGGSKGAAIGAAAGAGLGGGSGLLFHGNDLRLEKDTQLELRVDRDLKVPER
jgi:hypothetical protein